MGLHIVLVSPEIPGNTGSIGRTCVALEATLHLIHPLGFDTDEKALRRAGLDYWKHVDCREHKNLEQFFERETPTKDQLFLFSRFAEQSYFSAKFKTDSYLLFGSETKGLTAELTEQYPEQLYSLPTYSEHIRSLNLANAATTAAYEYIRQTKKA